jgi:hypothetical protein
MHQIAFLVFVAVIVVARINMVRARRALTVEQKAKLLDVSSRIWQYIIYIVVLFGGLFAISHFASNGAMAAHGGAFYICVIVWLLVLIGVGVWFRLNNFRRLRREGFPVAYLRNMIWSSSAIYIMVIALFVYSLLMAHH